MTAKEFLEKQGTVKDQYSGLETYLSSNVEKAMIEFAQYHVQEALKSASEKSRIIDDPNSYTGNTGSEYPPDQIIDRESILNSYPLENIK